MRAKRAVVAFLLAAGLCLMSGVGHGTIRPELVVGKIVAWKDFKVSLLDYLLLEAKLDYMMRNFENFENIYLEYDMDGSVGRFYGFPETMDTTNKIVIVIEDIRDYYSPFFLSLVDLSIVEGLEKQLKIIYLYIKDLASDMDNDVVARVSSKEGIKLAYFYQGEYHLWGEQK